MRVPGWEGLARAALGPVWLCAVVVALGACAHGGDSVKSEAPEAVAEVDVESVGPMLWLVRHVAECGAGPVEARAVEVRGEGGTLRVVLAVGEEVGVPLVAGEYGLQALDADGAALGPIVSAQVQPGRTVAPSRGGPRAALELGCSPHRLRQQALGALLFVSEPFSTTAGGEVASFQGALRVGGITVELAHGARHQVMLPRGSHALSLYPEGGASGGRCELAALAGEQASRGPESRLVARVEIRGAGQVLYIDACGLIRAEPL